MNFLRRLFGRPEPMTRLPVRYVRKPEEALAIFQRQMWRELLAGNKKSGWSEAKPEDILQDLLWCGYKIGHAMKMGRIEAVNEYATDLANLAMMLTDTTGGLRADGEAKAE